MANISVNAQNHQSGNTGMIGRRALVLDITTRVVDKEQVAWSESSRKVAIPGNPVGVQLVGSNIVVVVQFTPYIRSEGNVLVAQGQIWIAGSDNTVSYYTSIQTIPMELGEQIFFFPLGSSQHLDPSIEIILTVNQYQEGASGNIDR
ncbi:MAG: hypothetical protein LBQ89_06425 [Treponema sp.]|jgi:hypothetical protein|nr:hypothetical protein [Treponema sp.]